MITAKQLSHLQKLANISLDSRQEQKFVGDLWSVIAELEKLQTIDVWSLNSSFDEPMPIRSGVSDTTNTKDLLENVDHPLINNSPVIKSVLEN